MDKKGYLYAALYTAGYLLFLQSIGLSSLYLYFIVLVAICKVLSSYFIRSIRRSSKSVKPFSAANLRSGLFTLFFGLGSFVVREYPDAQRVLMAFICASIVFPTIVDAVKMLYAKDPSWLIAPDEKTSANPDGYIGAANIISITRIAIAAALPLLFTWISSEQGRAMCFIALVTVMFTDCIDGHVARLTKTVTKAGKYLDPLGDKVLFIPCGIAFVLYFAIHGTINSRLVLATAIMLAITSGRDILFFIWFATKSQKYPKGIGAGWTDKIRVNVIDAWMIVSANLITIGVLEQASVITSLALGALMTALSVISIFIDIHRIKNMTAT